MKITLATKITIARIILIVPTLAMFILAQLLQVSYAAHVALVALSAFLFAVCCATDFIDGHIARKTNTVSMLGKFLDPLADKLLVVTALICFVELGWASAWVTAIIVAREFVVSGIRLIAAGREKQIVIAASIWGKLKTASTMVAICVIIIMHILVSFGVISAEIFPVQLISDILMYISCILTAISGIKYFWDYREIFAGENKN